MKYVYWLGDLRIVGSCLVGTSVVNISDCARRFWFDDACCKSGGWLKWSRLVEIAELMFWESKQTAGNCRDVIVLMSGPCLGPARKQMSQQTAYQDVLRSLVAGVPCRASAPAIYHSIVAFHSALPFPTFRAPFAGQRHIDSMTTTKGLFDRFVDRLDFLVMGDRSKARTSDAVLNIVTAAGFVSPRYDVRAFCGVC